MSSQDLLIRFTCANHLLQDVLNGRQEKVKEYEYVGK
jgi:hypothetical protein